MRRAMTLLAVLALGLACGCGGSGDRAQISTATASFFSAIGKQDGSAACAELSQNTVKTLEQQEQGRCEKAVMQLGLKPAAIRQVELYAFNAKIDLANGSSAFLERTAQGWRIDSVGCRPTGGPPTSHPMNCSLEG